MDKYDTLEYSWVKVTTVSVHLQISLFALTNTNTNEGMTEIKVVDLDEYYNFYVYDFLSSNHLVSQNFV